jgi:signal transduction histidine kinase/Tfp pilus assembly protein PilF
LATSKIKNGLLLIVSIFCLCTISNSLFADKIWPYQRATLNAYSEVDDSLKLETLIKLSLAYQYINPDSCLPIALRAKTLLENLKADSYRPYLYNCFSSAYINKQISDSSVYWLHKAFSESKKQNNLKEIAQSLNNFGVYYSNFGYNHVSLSFYNKSLFIRQLIKDSNGISSCLNNMSNTNMKLGNLQEARIQLLQSLDIKIKRCDTNSIARAFMNLSNVYLSIGDFDKAISTLKTAQAWQELSGAGSEFFSIHTNLGGTYFYQNKFIESKKEFELALKNSIENNQILNQAISYNNLGEVETNLKNYQTAESYFKKSEIICKIVKDYEAEAASNLGRAKILSIKNDQQGAINLYKKGIEILEKYDFKPTLVLSYKDLILVYEQIGDYKSAYEYYKKLHKIEDELAISNSNEKIQKLEYENTLAQKQAEISILEKDKELAKSLTIRNTIIISLLILVLIFVSIVLVFVLKSRKAKITDNLIIKQQSEELKIQADLLKKLNEIKDKTFSILSHDLKSPLVSLQQTLFMLDENLIEKEEFTFIKDSLREKFSSLNQLLENLLNWSRARISGNFSLKPELIILSNIIQQNITLFNAQIEQKELIIENNIDLKHCVYADFNQLDLVLRNVIINAIKFSFVGGKIITSSFMKDESCMISVQDFGTGMTQKDLNSINQGDLISSKTGTSGEKGTGIGLIISRDFVIQNKGILQIKSELQKGSTIVIELPRA